MGGTVFTIIGLLIGAAIAGAGIYYLIKEKNDKDSKKIYGTFTRIGLAIVIGVVIKIIVAGF